MGELKDLERQEKFIFGQCGVVRLVKVKGGDPFQARGAVSGILYVWSDRRPAAMVDKRDLPSIAEFRSRFLEFDDDDLPKRRGRPPKQDADPVVVPDRRPGGLQREEEEQEQEALVVDDETLVDDEDGG